MAYANILFNFFLGDDFVHLTWLSKAVHDPSLLARNFNHNWLDIQTFRFYRPFISVVMFSDYMIWGANGLGFHLTNVLYHVASALLVFSITRQLASKLPAQNFVYEDMWPTAAALLFGLYPLHCEPVSWITGRVDTIVTTFYLLSVWCYIRWREHSKVPLLCASLGAMTMALFSKEMAVTVPALLACYQFIFSPAAQPKWTAKLVETAKATSAHWLLLALYFFLRRISLGTFVGGYDDSLFYVANWKDFLNNWSSGFFMIFVPVNRVVIGGRNIVRILWDVAMLGALSALFFSMVKGSWRLLVFLTIWCILGLAPVYKVFAILPDLQGSRLAYVFTVPLSILLTYCLCCAISYATQNKKLIAQRLAEGALVLLIVSSYILLFLNNEVWRHAGIEMNAIRASLQKIYEETGGDPQTLLIGMPDEVNGAYVGRNALPGMLEKPQFPVNVRNCVFFNDALPIMPFGFLKESLKKACAEVRIYFWNRPNRTWQKVNLADAGKNPNPSVYLQKPDTPTRGRTEPSAEAVLARAGGTLIRTESENPASCFNSDFLYVRTKAPVSRLVLDFRNDLTLRGKVSDATLGEDFDWDGSHGVLFHLRADPIWALGGSAHAISLRAKDPTELQDARFIPAEQIMPFITFSNSGYLGTKGYLHLSASNPSGTVSCFQNEIAGATGFCLEIMRANLFFSPEELNAAHSTQKIWKEIVVKSKTGDIKLTRDLFPTSGIYQARAWALDAAGKRIGVAGDHIDIAAD